MPYKKFDTTCQTCGKELTVDEISENYDICTPCKIKRTSKLRGNYITNTDESVYVGRTSYSPGDKGIWDGDFPEINRPSEDSNDYGSGGESSGGGSSDSFDSSSDD